MKDKFKEKVRIKDIAEKIGVSRGTIDRVLHNRSDVKSDTREKVLAAIKELGYTPNLLAKSLSSKKTLSIAVIIPEITKENPYWNKLHTGIQKAGKEIENYNVYITCFTYQANQKTSYKASIKEALASQPNGVILHPIFEKEAYAFTLDLDRKNIPYVYIDIDLQKGNNLAYFGQDAWQSGFLAAKLLSLSIPANSHILILKLSNSKGISYHIEKREAGFLSYLEKHPNLNISIESHLVDLQIKNELAETLNTVLENHTNLAGIFVAGSLVFNVAEYLSKQNLTTIKLIGYDLIEANIKELKQGNIDILLSQKPVEQGYKSVIALFKNIVSKEKVDQINFSPIDIIVKENLACYNEKKW